MLRDLWRQLVHITGSDYGAAYGHFVWYSFWSGFGSGPVAWCVLIPLYWLHHICHEQGCYRWGHPNTIGIVRCRKHNPEVS